MCRATIERRSVTACLRDGYRGEKILASMGSLAHYMQELSREGSGSPTSSTKATAALGLALATGPAAHAGWMLVEEQSEGGDVLAHRRARGRHLCRGMTRICEGGGVALYRRQ